MLPRIWCIMERGRAIRLTITPERRLFWFLRDGVTLDLTEPSMVDLYVQQVLTHGRADDVRQLLARLGEPRLIESFKRVGHFLPKEVRKFWEDFIGHH